MAPSLFAHSLFSQLDQAFQLHPKLLFQGKSIRPAITREPSEHMKKGGHHIPVVLMELEDDDLVKLFTGGLSGVNGVVSGKLTITGDMLLAQKLEYVLARLAQHVEFQIVPVCEESQKKSKAML